MIIWGKGYGKLAASSDQAEVVNGNSGNQVLITALYICYKLVMHFGDNQLLNAAYSEIQSYLVDKNELFN